MKLGYLLRRAVLAFCLVLFASQNAIAAKRLALVIGNDEYEHVARLKKAGNDASAIGDTLKSLGFEVMLAKNLGRRAMNLKLANFTQSIGRGDEVLFFFAGHGIEIDGANHLLPTDIPGGRAGGAFVRSEAISVNRILDMIRTRGARVSILVLDACRNNPFKQSAGRSIGAARGLGRIAAPEGTFIMYSAGVGQIALDGLSDNDKDPNSVFTRTLVPLLKQPGLKLTDMARSLRRKVKKLASTVSHKQRPAYYDEVTGSFFFVPGEGNTASAPTSNSNIELTFWNSVKDSARQAELQSYIDNYPSGAFVSLAKIRIAALKPQQASEPGKPELDRGQLVTKLQRALKKARCYTGRIDGDWGSGSRKALRRFAQAAKSGRRYASASRETLDFVLERRDALCPLERVRKKETGKWKEREKAKARSKKKAKRNKKTRKMYFGHTLAKQIGCCVKFHQKICRGKNPYFKTKYDRANGCSNANRKSCRGFITKLRVAYCGFQ